MVATLGEFLVAYFVNLLHFSNNRGTALHDFGAMPCFGKVFKEHLDGWMLGGDRIYGVFDHQLPAVMKKLPLDRHLSLNNVKKVINEADGYQPHVIAPELGYRRLIDGSIGCFKGPAEASVDAVHFNLKELVRKSIVETHVYKSKLQTCDCQITARLKRFPSLQNDIATAANDALERFRDESRKTILRLVEMEKQSLCDLKVANSTEHHIAFKVKTTSPKKYFVQPNTGVIQPWDSCIIRGSG